MEFSQTEFFSLYSSTDSTGYIYVPTACRNNGTSKYTSLDIICNLISFIVCRLHIAFHGCEMGR